MTDARDEVASYRVILVRQEIRKEISQIHGYLDVEAVGRHEASDLAKAMVVANPCIMKILGSGDGHFYPYPSERSVHVKEVSAPAPKPTKDET